jgi:hypothetical protein
MQEDAAHALWFSRGNARRSYAAICTGTAQGHNALSCTGENTMNNKTDMPVDEQLLAKLDSVNRTLEHIHRNLLWVFWLVAVFALLYFGLLIYLLA